MDPKTAQLIQKYQETLAKDPHSKVFASLAESYRRMNMLNDAENLCRKGLIHHPHFASGHLVYARVLIDKEKHSAARAHLNKVLEYDPENLLAYNLLGDCYLKLKDPKSALNAFKMALFINPKDSKAQRAVKKLESLTADEYDEELFSMKPLKEAVKSKEKAKAPPPEKPQTVEAVSQVLDRYLSLADAYIVRNDIAKALSTLEEAEQVLGPAPLITQRLVLINHREPTPVNSSKKSAEKASEKPLSRQQLYREAKIEYLQSILVKVKERRRMLSHDRNE